MKATKRFHWMGWLEAQAGWPRPSSKHNELPLYALRAKQIGWDHYSAANPTSSGFWSRYLKPGTIVGV